MAELDQAPDTGARIDRVWIIATFLAVAAGRFAFSSDRRVFHISPDEPSQLAIARWLAGDRRWNMFDHATWQPGLGTLLTPVYWLTDDPTTAVRAALGFNAVLGGVGGVLLLLLIRRITWFEVRGAALVATVVALAPSSLSASAFVWAEPLVTVSFLAVVLALLRYLDTDRLAWAVAANVAAVAGYSCHSRLLVLVGTTAVITLGLETVRRRWARWGVIGASTAVAFIASAAWTRWILDNVWDDPSDQNTVGSVWERAQKPLEIGEAAIGQIWYQLVATLGVAGVGTYMLVRSLRRSGERGHDDRLDANHEHDGPDDVTGADTFARTADVGHDALSQRTDRDRVPVAAAWVLVVSTMPLLLLSAVFMSDRGRPDQYIYGRYNDAVMWPILGLGLVWLTQRAVAGFARRDAVAVAVTTVMMLATGVFVNALHGDEIRESYGVRSMIPGVLHFVDSDDVLDVRRVTIIAAATFLLVVGVLRLATVQRLPLTARGAALVAGAAVAIGVAAIGVTRLERTADLRLNGWEATAAIREIHELLPPGATVGVKPVSNSKDPVIKWVPQRQRFQMYQLYLPERTFVRDRGVDDPNGPYVLAPLQDRLLLEAGAEMIWRDPRARIGLWVEPSG